MARNVGIKIPYEPVWVRVKSVAQWSKDIQLANFLSVQPGTISGARKRDSFPIQWAFKIAQEFNCLTDWLLTGEGPVMVEPWRREACEDNVKEILGDQDAARRNRQRRIEAGDFLRQSREEAEDIADQILADLGLDLSKKEYFRHTLQTPIHARMAAEHQLDRIRDKITGASGPAGLTVDDYLCHIERRLTELEKKEPDIRAWFRVEFKKRFPELMEGKEEAETEVDKGQSSQKLA